MDPQSNSVSQQDALSNALLAIFMILILIMIQLGIRDVDTQVFEKSYGKEIPAEEPRRGPAPKSILVRARTVTLLTYGNNIHWNDNGAQAIRGDWTDTNKAPSFQQFSGDHRGAVARLAWLEINPAYSTFDWYLKIVNDGDQSEDVFVWLDDALAGSDGSPTPLAPSAVLFVHGCRQDIVMIFVQQDGSCP
jgi:hypothetical protein